ncbi:MAG: FMN-binding protein [Oscillospiraceae bacterium]|nr:FMN-binding protein [Oscillospiraceae bacterium]MBP3699077.1 FMN-binding protein [Oscillospiraceae bacterium]
MKISGKFVLKVAGTLTIIALVVAALLGVVDMVTHDKIDAINVEKTNQALAAVAPEGAEFTPVELSDAAVSAAAAYGTLDSMYEMSTGGYAMKIVASGSQGSIEMIVGVDANKALTGVSVVSHSETGGIGTKVINNDPNSAGTPVLDQFIGMSGAGSLVVGKTVTPISGATVTSKGITAGCNAALAAVEAMG